MDKLEELKQKVQEITQQDLSIENIEKLSETLFDITDKVLTELQKSINEKIPIDETV